MAECGKRVGKGAITYPCIVEVSGAPHPGPCAARDIPRTMRDREQWMAQQEEGERARRVLAEVQGPPMAFHELRGEPGSATPVPGSNLQPKEFRQAHKPRVGEFGESLPPIEEVAGMDIVVDERVSKGAFVLMPQLPEGVAFAPLSDGTWATVLTEGEYAGHRVTIENGAIKSIEPRIVVPDIVADRIDVEQVVEESMDILAEPTKQREGDQRLPEVNSGKFVQDLVIEDINERVEVGIKRYGTPLQAMNGRDAFLDAYEEALDLATYLRQVRVERAEMLAASNFVYSFLAAHQTNGTDSGLAEAVDYANQINRWLAQ